jgi:methionyl-tRNA formyltransferase
MRIVFFGSGTFSMPALQALIGFEEVLAVVTQPDRPAGRGHARKPPPTKQLATEHGITVLQPDNVNDDASIEALRALAGDVYIVAAYGQILRQRLLDLPARGSLNVHASLLPRHRGASPVAAAILVGDEVAGVSVMEVVRALDAGPVVSQREEAVSAHDTTATLEERLAVIGAELLVETLRPWAERRLTATPQDEALATYAPQLSRAEARIDWALPAVDLWRRIRAFNPWPVAFTTWRGEELRVLEAWPLDGDSGSPPGAVLDVAPLPAEAASDEATFSVQTGAGRLALLRMQRPGKRALSGLEFLRGAAGLIGSKLGE